VLAIETNKSVAIVIVTPESPSPEGLDVPNMSRPFSSGRAGKSCLLSNQK